VIVFIVGVICGTLLGLSAGLGLVGRVASVAFVFWLLLGSIGCSVPVSGSDIEVTQSLVLEVHPDYDPEIWQEAANEWCDAGAPCVLVAEDSRTPHVHAGTASFCENEPGHVEVAHTTYRLGEIYICVFDDPTLHRFGLSKLDVARHELGHWLGCSHQADGTMKDDGGEKPAPTRKVVERCGLVLSEE
jgi:hypothetical protein